jgi:hypothetical protein
MMKIDGGCHCGNITYTAEIDPENVGIYPRLSRFRFTTESRWVSAVAQPTSSELRFFWRRR